MAKIKTGGDGASAMAISALKAQQARMLVIAENVANSDSAGRTPGGEPYRRQIPVFEVAETEGGQEVRMKGVVPDMSPFAKLYAPGHPAAEKAGDVLTPNVNGLIESLDMKEAARAYEANLSVLENQDAMDKSTLALLQK